MCFFIWCWIYAEPSLYFVSYLRIRHELIVKHIKDLSIIPKRSDHHVQFLTGVFFYILYMKLLNINKCDTAFIKWDLLFDFQTIQSFRSVLLIHVKLFCVVGQISCHCIVSFLLHYLFCIETSDISGSINCFSWSELFSWLFLMIEIFKYKMSHTAIVILKAQSCAHYCT